MVGATRTREDDEDDGGDGDDLVMLTVCDRSRIAPDGDANIIGMSSTRRTPVALAAGLLPPPTDSSTPRGTTDDWTAVERDVGGLSKGRATDGVFDVLLDVVEGLMTSRVVATTVATARCDDAECDVILSF